MRNTTNNLRHKLTQNLLTRVMERSERGFNSEDVLMDIAFNPDQPAEIRLRAATQITNLIFPKAQSVEMTAEVTADVAIADMDKRIQELLGMGPKVEVEEY